MDGGLRSATNRIKSTRLNGFATSRPCLAMNNILRLLHHRLLGRKNIGGQGLNLRCGRDQTRNHRHHCPRSGGNWRRSAESHGCSHLRLLGHCWSCLKSRYGMEQASYSMQIQKRGKSLNKLRTPLYPQRLRGARELRPRTHLPNKDCLNNQALYEPPFAV